MKEVSPQAQDNMEKCPLILKLRFKAINTVDPIFSYSCDSSASGCLKNEVPPSRNMEELIDGARQETSVITQTQPEDIMLTSYKVVGKCSNPQS